MTPTPLTEELFHEYYYKGWNKANEQVLTKLLDPNVEFRGVFRRKPIRGIPAFMEYMRKAHKALAKNVVEIQEVVVNGNKAALRLMNRGIHKGDFFGVQATGCEVSWSSAAFFTIDANTGLIVKIWVLGDIDGLKNQIGASQEASVAF